MVSKNSARTFGTTRRKVASVGQGTWKIEAAAADAAIAALRRGLDLGLTHIDTAEMYGSGASEKIIGKAIAGRREEVPSVQGAPQQCLKKKRNGRLREILGALAHRSA